MKKFIYLKYFVVSIVSLLVGVLFFIYGYLHRKILAYILAITFLIAFIAVSVWSNKKMTFDEGYSLLQAYLLYLKCYFKKIFVEANKLTETEKNEIINIAKSFDLPKDFYDMDYLKMFRIGYKVSLEIKKHTKRIKKTVLNKEK